MKDLCFLEEMTMELKTWRPSGIHPGKGEQGGRLQAWEELCEKAGRQKVAQDQKGWSEESKALEEAERTGEARPPPST